jgi:carbonic anhydrase/acetyltransferase-like protein (isoleucine patch superfamily)
LRDQHPDLHIYAPITVGDHVFIGMGAMVLPGVTIGSRCVIGAGSVVTRDIPDGTVAAGVPCRPIRSIEEYRERACARGINWPVGRYDAAWRAMVMRHAATGEGAGRRDAPLR